MAIVKMNKFNLYSFDSKREFLLKTLQKFKYVHLNDLEHMGADDEVELEKVQRSDELLELDEDILQAEWAIELLKKYEEKKSAIRSLEDGNKSFTLLELTTRAENFEFKYYYNELYELKEKQNQFEQIIQKIDMEIDEFRPWEDIPYKLDSLRNLRSIEFRLGTIPTKYLPDFEKDIENLEFTTAEVISQSSKMTYLIIVLSSSEELESVEDAIRKNGFITVDLKTDNKVKEKIRALNDEKQELQSEIKSIEKRIYSHIEWLEDFRIYYEYLVNKKLRLVSSEKFLKTDQVDLIEGYIPLDKKETFIDVLDNLLGNEANKAIPCGVSL